ncbi:MULTISPECIES: winged helix-turn-helix transcriptional regulator [Bacillus]|uniref:HTH hxlR-type domain-containing protein n=2 Tax=Bacillus TaxID=1386 RepID=A0A0M5JCE3_9BACI|nr:MULTISPECIES: helix-turn-helix domain-containing protein [Bacillus]ALC83169.1 hypothetical protein AM592_17545 [Bacillus gobiensis]MBP1082245.1 DNA-binding HxlR family transcriptional regulator [Bacillus capparidis]MED1096856.1 helix-turn-helix domain-containing protein [Bacillus capparidis]
MEETKIILERSDDEQCPIEKSLTIISAKWSFLIIRELLIDGTLRFGDLLKGLEGISPKTLSLRLRELEENKIITRTVYPEIPPKVEYSLTEKGKQLEGILLELKRFGLTLE